MTGSFLAAHLSDVLRKVLSLPAESELECTLQGESGNILAVKFQGVCEEYVLLKVPNSTPSPLINENNHSLLQPEFIIHKQGESYGAFNKKRLHNFAQPDRNNSKHLKAILRTLAQVQAGSENNQGNSEYALEDIVDTIASLDYFKSIGKISTTLKELQEAFNGLLQSKLLVKSVWTSLAGNVYVNQEGTASLFLQTSSQQSMPPAYDALLYIFSLSDEQFRQKHFEELVSFYFKSLKEALKEKPKELCEEINRTYAELQLSTLLPVVKFRYAKDLSEASKSSSEFEAILANLSSYLKYPLIQQEDVYQVIKHKLASSDYGLLDYKFVPLNERNGSLGEYFHVIISVQLKNKEQTLNLFAKHLINTNHTAKEVIASGVGAKEDFFFTIFYPLFQEHNLESLFDFAPKCYLSKLNGLTILDDLGFLGYSTIKHNILLGKDGIRAVLRQVAKLHASSIILEGLLSKQTGKAFSFGDEYADYLQESLLLYDSHMRSWYDGSIDSLWWIMAKFPDLTKDLGLSSEELKEKLKNVILSVFSKIKRSETLKNVINHGDMHIGNMLFKLAKDGAVEDAILIDFQLLRYVPPAYEVLFFIFVNTDKKTTSKYLATFLDCYYDGFSTCLRNFSLDPDEIYSRKQFEDDAHYVKSAALGMAFCYRHLNQMNTHIREEFGDPEKYKYYMEDHKEELMEMLWKEEPYRVLLKDFMEDFIDLIKSG